MSNKYYVYISFPCNQSFLFLACLSSRPLLEYLSAPSFTASNSSTNILTSPEMSLLNSASGWIADDGSGSNWIQANLLDHFHLLHVATQGHSSFEAWVISYSLQTGYTETHLAYILNVNGSAKVFDGNTNQSSVVNNTLDDPVRAWLVRLDIVTFNNQPAIRWELYGCIASKS